MSKSIFDKSTSKLDLRRIVRLGNPHARMSSDPPASGRPGLAPTRRPQSQPAGLFGYPDRPDPVAGAGLRDRARKIVAYGARSEEKAGDPRLAEVAAVSAGIFTALGSTAAGEYAAATGAADDKTVSNWKTASRGEALR